jgi:class 3 adenylate cyclase
VYFFVFWKQILKIRLPLIGSNVNFANRLEGVVDNDELLVSEEKIKSVREKFALKSFDRDIYSYGEAKADQIISKL